MSRSVSGRVAGVNSSTARGDVRQHATHFRAGGAGTGPPRSGEGEAQIPNQSSLECGGLRARDRRGSLHSGPIMTRHPSFGIFLALFGALAISPDTLLMRWSQMSGAQMIAWRGLLMGTMLLSAWLVFRRGHLHRDLRMVATGAGILVVFCQFANASLFAVGIAAAPVSVVLFSVSTVPVFAALLSRIFLKEPSHWSTWAAIAAVLGGIGLAVFGKTPGMGVGTPILGAAAGLGVALSLALTFVTIRRTPDLPILLAVGCGAVLAGAAALIRTGPETMFDGRIWAIALAGGLVLPVSFFSLSFASRHTPASNVSLVMLLETILGPIWVWAGTGEAPTPAMLTGGAIVIASLMLYLWHSERRKASHLTRAGTLPLEGSETAPQGGK